MEPQIVTERVVEKLGQGLDTRQRQTITTLTHFGFGAAAGAVYGPVANRIPLPPWPAPLFTGCWCGPAAMPAGCRRWA